jgi:hypothetical protein
MIVIMMCRNIFRVLDCVHNLVCGCSPSQRFRTELEDSVLNVLVGFGFLSDANVVQ